MICAEATATETLDLGPQPNARNATASTATCHMSGHTWRGSEHLSPLHRNTTGGGQLYLDGHDKEQHLQDVVQMKPNVQLRDG